ncbi:MAG: hypothetical protein WC900_02135 [Oscillospiraceae bacterium]
MGAYKSGTNPALDESLKKIDNINKFLCQDIEEAFDYKTTVELMKQSIS